MNTQQRKEARLAVLRDVAAHDWSSLGRFKVADLNADTRSHLDELRIVRQRQQAVYNGDWTYGELAPAAQLAIDSSISIEYPELFEADV